MVRYGLKVWSTNRDLFPAARAAVAQGQADFVELYTVPGQTDPAALTKDLGGVPVTIHAPHENHGFDLHRLTDEQAESFRREVSGTADALKASIIVVHAGVGDSGERFADNFRRLHEPRIVLENMPKDALGGGTCFGYSLEQIRFLHQLSVGKLCIDFGHAIKSAVSQGLDYHDFISEILNTFRPSYFHLADGDPTTEEDEHRSLGEGSYDLPWIAAQVRSLGERAGVSVVFEVPKGVGLEDDLRAIKRFRKL